MGEQWLDIEHGRMFTPLDNRKFDIEDMASRGVKIYQGIDVLAGLCALIAGKAGLTRDEHTDALILYNVESMGDFLVDNLEIRDEEQRARAHTRAVTDEMVQWIATARSREQEIFVAQLGKPQKSKKSAEDKEVYRERIRGSLTSIDEMRWHFFQFINANPPSSWGEILRLSKEHLEILSDIFGIPNIREDATPGGGKVDLMGRYSIPRDRLLNYVAKCMENKKVSLEGGEKDVKNFMTLVDLTISDWKMTCSQRTAKFNKLIQQAGKKVEQSDSKEEVIGALQLMKTTKPEARNVEIILSATRTFLISGGTVRESTESPIEFPERVIIDTCQFTPELIASSVLAPNGLVEYKVLRSWFLSDESKHRNIVLPVNQLYVRVDKEAFLNGLALCGVPEQTLYDIFREKTEQEITLTYEQIVAIREYIATLPSYRFRVADTAELPNTPIDLEGRNIEFMARGKSDRQVSELSTIRQIIEALLAKESQLFPVIVDKDDFWIACRAVGLHRIPDFVEKLAEIPSGQMEIDPQSFAQIQYLLEQMETGGALALSFDDTKERARIFSRLQEAFLEKGTLLVIEQGEEGGGAVAPLPVVFQNAWINISCSKDDFKLYLSQYGMMTREIEECLDEIEGENIVLSKQFLELLEELRLQLRQELIAGFRLPAYTKSLVVADPLQAHDAKRIDRKKFLKLLDLAEEKEISKNFYKIDKKALKGTLASLNMLTTDMAENIDSGTSSVCVLSKKALEDLRQFRKKLVLSGIGGIPFCQVEKKKEPFAPLPAPLIGVVKMSDVIFILQKSEENLSDQDILFLCGYMKTYDATDEVAGSHTQTSFVNYLRQMQNVEMQEKVIACAKMLSTYGLPQLGKLLKSIGWPFDDTKTLTDRFIPVIGLIERTDAISVLEKSEENLSDEDIYILCGYMKNHGAKDEDVKRTLTDVMKYFQQMQNVEMRKKVMECAKVLSPRGLPQLEKHLKSIGWKFN